MQMTLPEIAIITGYSPETKKKSSSPIPMLSDYEWAKIKIREFMDMPAREKIAKRERDRESSI